MRLCGAFEFCYLAALFQACLNLIIDEKCENQLIGGAFANIWSHIISDIINVKPF